MAFFGGLVNRVVQSYKTIERSLTNTYRTVEKTFAQNPFTQRSSQSAQPKFTIHTNIASGRGGTEASIVVFTSQDVINQLGTQIGRTGTQIVQDLLTPVSRTSALKNSFKFKLDPGNQSVVIYSQDPAASVIQEGRPASAIPSTQKLAQWLATKDEYISLTDPQLNRLAFNIRRKMERNEKPSARSTIMQLRPTGEPRYDYLGLAVEQLSTEIENMLSQIQTGIVP